MNTRIVTGSGEDEIGTIFLKSDIYDPFNQFLLVIIHK